MASQHKRQWGFRAAEPLSQRIEQFTDANNMSQSDALRRLVREGLEAEELRDEVDQLEQRVERLEEDSGWWPFS